MVIFHVHERSVRIGLAIIIPSLKTGSMSIVECLALQKTPEPFQVFPVTAFLFPPSMDKNSMLFFADLFQKPTDLLKLLCPCGFRHLETLYVFLVQKQNGLLYLLKHFGFPFPYRFFPDESIFVCTSLQFCPINKNSFRTQFSRIFSLFTI